MSFLCHLKSGPTKASHWGLTCDVYGVYELYISGVCIAIACVHINHIVMINRKFWVIYPLPPMLLNYLFVDISACQLFHDF